jgi:hypothetical protein
LPPVGGAADGGGPDGYPVFHVGVSALWVEMLVTDLTEKVTELAVPAYFWHGIHDYTVN